MVTSTQCNDGVAGLLLQNPRHFAWQFSLPVSQSLPASSPSPWVQLTTYAGTSSSPDSRYTVIYAHTSPRILPTCDISLCNANVTCARTWRLCGINPAVHFCMERELVVMSLCPECCSNIKRCQWHLQFQRLQFISWIVKLCVTELVFQESLQCTGKREGLAHVCFVYWLIYIWLVNSNVNEFL